MEYQPTKLDKAVKISIIAGVLILALSVAYYLVIFMPSIIKNKENARKECVSWATATAKETYSGKLEATRKNIDAGGKTFSQASEELTGRPPSASYNIEREQGYYTIDYDSYFSRCLKEKGLTS